MNIFDKILAHLRDNAIEHRILEHEPVRTVEEAIVAGFDLETLLKTVVFRAKGEPARYFLCAVRAQDGVDYKKLSAAVGTKRDALIRPAPEEVEQVLGFEAGAVGPFAVTPETQVLFDEYAVRTLDMIHCGSGRTDRTLCVRITDLIRLSNGKVAPLMK